MRNQVTASITAQNTFTGWVHLGGLFQLFISGLVASTVTFQGTPDDGVTIYDLDEWTLTTDNTIHVGQVPSTDWTYRVGIKTGDFGAGETVIVRLEA